MSDFTDWMDSPDGTVVPGGPPAKDTVQQENDLTDFLSPSDPSPALRAAIPTNPDKNAKALQTAAGLGVPVDTVQANPENAEAELKHRQTMDLIKDSPTTVDWLSDVNNAEVGHDSADKMVGMEKALAARDKPPAEDDFITAMGKVLQNAPDTLKEWAGGALQYLGETPPMPSTGYGLNENDPGYQEDVVQPFNRMAASKGNILKEKGEELYKAAAADIYHNQPNPHEGVSKDAVDLADSLIQMIPTMLTTLLTKNPEVGVATLAAQTAGQTYGESRNTYELDPLEARQRAILYATAESLPEVMPLESMMKTGKFLPNFLKTIGLEGVSEAFTQIIEDGYDSQTVNPDMTWGQAWDNMVRAGKLGMYMGGAMHIAAVPFHARQEAKMAQSTNTLDAIEEAHKESESSPLTERDPAAQSDFARKVFEDNGIKEVNMDSQGLQELADKENMPLADYLTKKLGVPSEQAQQAAQLGTDVTLPTEQYINNVFMSDEWEDLSKHARYSPDELTAAETEQYKKSGLQDEIQRVANSTQASDVEVTEDHIKELKEAGYSDDDIKAFTPQQVEDLTGKSVKAQRTDIPVALAEQELGLQGLFKDAKEAGMTEGQYAQYAQGQVNARVEARNRLNEYALKRQLREQTDSWKAERENVKTSLNESIGNEQTYQAVNNIGRDRLDRKAMEAALPRDQYKWDGEQFVKSPREWNLKDVEATHGKLFTEKGVDGQDPDAYAIAHGYRSATEMIKDMMDKPSQKDAVRAALDGEMSAKHGELEGSIGRTQQALQAVHTNEQANVLAAEVNALREAKKGGRIKAKLVRQASKDYIREQLTYKDVTSSKFLNAAGKLGRAAYKALRAGDRAKAAQLKYQQLLNFTMSQQAYTTRAKMTQEQRYLKKFTKRQVKGLPQAYLDPIKELLGGVQLGGRPSKKTENRAWAEEFAKAIGQGNAFIDVPKKLLDQMGKTNWQDLKIEDWNSLVETVKTLETIGKDEQKLRDHQAKLDRIGEAEAVAENITKNFKDPKPEYGTPSRAQTIKNTGLGYIRSIFNMDTVSKLIDRGDFGNFYNSIKGRYDRAMSNGYREGQIGYNGRIEVEANRLNRLFNMFTKAEQVNMKQRNIQIDGFDTPVSHDFILSTLLNSGNEGNLQAMVKSGRMTEAQIKAIHDIASPKDIKFANEVFKYLDEFRPEIQEAHERRTGYKPEMVKGMQIQLKNGLLEGGYYPIRYDTQKAISGKSLRENSHDDISKAIEDIKYGRAVASHTTRGHMEARTGGDGRALLMDTSVLNSHVQNVVYDLEVGDALSDAYRVLNHPITAKAFETKGQQDLFHMSNLWLDDVIARERIGTSDAERIFRYIRNGYTLSKLGFKTGTAAMQLLGMTQSAVHIGPTHLLRGLDTVIRGQWTGPHSIFNVQNADSQFMAHRSHTWNSSTNDAAKAMTNNFIRKWTPGESAKFVNSAAFYMLLKVQKLVDHITYAGAKQKGMDVYEGNEDKARLYAERMVAQAQGSGIFGDRSGWERGTLSKNTRQSEFVKGLNPLISYMMAKNNVAAQKTIGTNFKNPGHVLRWTGDMLALYAVESLITAGIYGQWPSGDDDDEDSLPVFAAKQVGFQVMAGLPVLNAFSQAAQGYRAGGVYSAVIQEYKDLNENLDKNGMNEAATRQLNDLLGVAFHYPSSATNQIMRMVDKTNNDETLEWYEYVFGPNWDKDK